MHGDRGNAAGMCTNLYGKSNNLVEPMQGKGDGGNTKRQFTRTSLAETFTKAVRAHAGEGEQGQYQVAIETGEACNLSGSLAGLGFRSSEGVSPGRVLRVIHAVVRTIFLAMGTKKAELAHADEIIEKVSIAFAHLFICLACSPLHLAPWAKSGRLYGCVWSFLTQNSQQPLVPRGLS